MPGPDTVIVNDLEIVCYGCRDAKEHFRGVAMSTDPEEQWSALPAILAPKGWAVLGEPGNRHAYCPACVNAASDPVQELPPFNHKARCTMCGHNRIKTVYDSGMLPQSKYHQPHLTRTCERCGFKWYEGPVAPGEDRDSE